MNFTHLHIHSHYSVLDGMSKVPDLINKCLQTGMHAIALTDHGCMYGIKELLDCAKKTNKNLKTEAQEKGIDFVPFKPIVGVEAYCARRGRKDRDKDLKAISAEGKQYIVDQSGWHLVLLAKNKTGYHNLCKIVSESFMDDCYYRRPRIDKELLTEISRRYHLLLCLPRWRNVAESHGGQQPFARYTFRRALPSSYRNGPLVQKHFWRGLLYRNPTSSN